MSAALRPVIHVQEAVVTRRALLIEDDLVEREPLDHPFEHERVAFLDQPALRHVLDAAEHIALSGDVDHRSGHEHLSRLAGPRSHHHVGK
jgi:hypothetical protein